MRIRNHFRTSKATIDLIIDDFSFNRISNKDVYFKYCVNKRMEKLNERYDKKLDHILTFIIKRCDFENIPIKTLSKIIASLSHITNVLSKGFMSIIDE